LAKQNTFKKVRIRVLLLHYFHPKNLMPKTLYEEQYCARGDMENRIKEQQLYLFADRTSAATM